MRVQKGLTLVEILIAMGIATTVGVLLLVVIVNSAGLFSQQSTKVEIGMKANDSFAKFRSSIKQASAVVVSYTDGPTTYTTGTTELVLTVPSQDAFNNVIDNKVDYFVFFVDQTYLRLKIFPDSLSSRIAENQVLATQVDSLLFEYFNSANPPMPVTPTQATKVKMTLTLKQKAGMDFETSTITSEANLRND